MKGVLFSRHFIPLFLPAEGPPAAAGGPDLISLPPPRAV
jgi:hypothetical protein